MLPACAFPNYQTLHVPYLFILLTPLHLCLAHQHQLFIHIINSASVVTVHVFITIPLLHIRYTLLHIRYKHLLNHSLIMADSEQEMTPAPTLEVE